MVNGVIFVISIMCHNIVLIHIDTDLVLTRNPLLKVVLTTLV